MSGIISGATQRLIARLAASTLPTDGPGAVGYARGPAWPHGTLGARIGERVSITEFMSAAQRNDAKAQALAVDCVTAFSTAHTQLAHGDTIELPPGWMFRIDSPLTFTKKIGIISNSKAYTTLAAFGFGLDVPMLTYAGLTGARIQDIQLKGFRFWSNNNLASGLNLTWVNKSSFADLYFYNLNRGWVGDNAWSNSWRNASAFGITQETALLGDQCNNNDFSRCEFRGINGIRVTGNTAGLGFHSCDFEGITSAAGAGLCLEPATGKKIQGVALDGACYFENVRGNAIRTAGVDADSVLGLDVRGAYFFGGNAAYFASVAGQAQYAISLANVNGFTIEGNYFTDWQSAAIFRSSSEQNGSIRNNTASICPALTNSGNQAAQSVLIENNFVGRRKIYVSAMPTTGTFTQGDVAENTAPTKDANAMTAAGWVRLTTGAAHVPGTDWAVARVSHLTPAV